MAIPTSDALSFAPVPEGDFSTQLLIIGGTTGGVAAATAALRGGYRVALISETEWIGGQFSTQGVPPDEHFWIEDFGRTGTYAQLRERVRRLFKASYDGLTEAAAGEPQLNPGLGKVSTISAEPRLFERAVLEMLAEAGGERLCLLRHERAEAVEREGGCLRAVRLAGLRGGEPRTVTADFVLDATDAGDLLPLAGIPYTIGAESRETTGEWHALEGADDPHDLQAFTWCMILGYVPGAETEVPKPTEYDFWKQYRPQLDPPWPGPLFDWKFTMPVTFETIEAGLFPWEARKLNAWSFRRVRSAEHFKPDKAPPELSCMNWSQNDYFLRRPVDVPEAERERAFEDARQMAQSYLYHLRYEAERPDGKIGYPGLFGAGEATGTSDGLAQAPYLREGRRLKALFQVSEAHVGKAQREGRPAETFPDSVGVGYYRIDLHPSTAGRHFVNLASLPFQIPVRCLVSPEVTNCLVAGKAIGTTHLTNGCYRLHPIEWNIGESAAVAAMQCLERKLTPVALAETPGEVGDLQRRLENSGVELAWPDEAIQTILDQKEAHLHT